LRLPLRVNSRRRASWPAAAGAPQKPVIAVGDRAHLEDRQMRIIAATLFALFTTGLCQMAWASPEDKVHARFEQWIATFNSHDADRLSQLYDQDARLLSTGGSEKPLDGRETIHVYFIPFMKRGDTVVFDHDDAVKVISNIGIETGYYHFNTDPNGKPDIWVSRYTFVFEKKDGNWMILHHHSSRVPNLTAAPAR
jgi:uncharacterized protein (TIGR02246 family)